MNFSWHFLFDMSILGGALLLATLLRAKITILQKYLVPNALTAGFLLLPLYNRVLPKLGMGMVNLENIVFHFLNLSFIAMSLRISGFKRNAGRDVFATSAMVLTQYVLQCFLGIILTLVMIATFLPDLFPGFGLFATLGFSLGPGQAFVIGSGWESMGFEGLSSVGLTFGALGYVWASFGGVFLVNYGIKKGWMSRDEIQRIKDGQITRGVLKRDEKGKISSVSDITNAEAIDPLSFAAGLIFMTYLLSWLGLTGITQLLGLLGDKGARLAENLWGIMFIFCGVTAMIVKRFIRITGMEHIVDNQRLNRFVGFCVDYMVAAAIAAINLAVVVRFWIPIVIIAVIVGLATTFTHIWLSSRVFQSHIFYRTVLIYGAATGTLPSGLALLRIIDPKFETPASRDYMLSAGITFLAAIPILLTANLPALGALAGTLVPTYQVLGLYVIYLILCAAAYLVLSGRRRFRNYSAIWMGEGY